MTVYTRILVAVLLSVTGALGAAERPNVIVVLTDDQGYGDLSFHGNPELRTPHLDQLARESIRLTDFHVAPMCTPTRGQLLTGRDALANGAMNVSSGRTLLRQEFPTMADLFAASGYRTGQFGKWHLGDNYPYRPQDRGFQESVFFPSSHIPSAGDYWNNDYFDDTYNHHGRREKYTGYCTDVFFDAGLEWMRKCHADGAPFFAYIATNAPHGPLYVPDKYREPYRHLPRNVASFFGMLANIDENMGKLESMLKETGLRENTLVIFMTDNGGTAGVNVFNAGMRGRKIELYDGGHRVPCLIRWPQGELRSAGEVDVLTQVQDLLPTFIDLCDLKKPATRFDGVSLAKLLRGETDRIEDRMFVIQFSRMNAPAPRKGDAAVLWKKWRLVNQDELYDVAADPDQSDNVASKHPDVVARMRAHYDAWWSQVEPRVNEFSAIHVGSETENPLLLSPCDWQDVFLDQGGQIRRGEAKNGPWNLHVERAGEYQISLARWPLESGLAITAAAPEYQAVDAVFPAGKALPVARARLKIGKTDAALSVESDAQTVDFSVSLPAGRTQLHTWFYDADGKELCGAYYAYVQRVAGR